MGPMTLDQFQAWKRARAYIRPETPEEQRESWQAINGTHRRIRTPEQLEFDQLLRDMDLFIYFQGRPAPQWPRRND